MVSVRHVFENAPDEIGAVLAFDIFSVAINMAADFSHERIPSSL